MEPQAVLYLMISAEELNRIKNVSLFLYFQFVPFLKTDIA